MYGGSDRDASFLPPSSAAPVTPDDQPVVVTAPGDTAPAIAVPAMAVPETNAPQAMAPPAAAPVVITALPPARPEPAADAAPTQLVPAQAAPRAPVAAAPAVIAPAPAPIAAAPVKTAPPVAVPPAASVAPVPVPAAAAPPAAPAVIAPAAAPVVFKKSVEANALENIDPESTGLIGNSEGGLGAAMWKGTTKLFVERLLPALMLPTPSPALNNLAQRFLLTTAAVPAGAGDGTESLTAMRIEKLLALGDAKDAWIFSQTAKPGQVDEITSRLVAEAALVSSEGGDVCAKLPEIVKTHASPEWQKLMLVCQLRAKDTKAAQLTLDLLHAQGIHDDIFFYIAEKNILGNNKQLPRQMTPLKPATLALLLLTDLPLPGELYSHPDAVLIPELLKAKAREDVARLALAERAAERGLISGGDLASVYASTVFTPEKVIAAANSTESGPRLHALLFQAATSQGAMPQSRVMDAVKLMQTASPGFLKGAGAQVLETMVDGIPPKEENNEVSGTMAHVYVLAGKADAALEWLKLARHASIGMPNVGAELRSIWPLTVFAGLESQTGYAKDMDAWLDASLTPADPKSDNKSLRAQVLPDLLLLEASGFAVPEEAWGKVADAPQFEKRLMPPAFLFERLRAAGVAGSEGRRGEAVMLGLLVGGSPDPALLPTLEAIRALRMVGLPGDAGSLARETAIVLSMPQK